MTRPPDLPDFERPPLYELVLSIQFARTQLRNINMGGIWALFRDRYPKVEEQPPLAPVFEKFGLPPAQAEGPRFILSQIPDVIRYWFIGDGGNELLQVQVDRLVHNWRKISPEAAYPRYEPLRAQFENRRSKELMHFCKLRASAEIRALNQCEVSYMITIRWVMRSNLRINSTMFLPCGKKLIAVNI